MQFVYMFFTSAGAVMLVIGAALFIGTLLLLATGPDESKIVLEVHPRTFLMCVGFAFLFVLLFQVGMQLFP